MGSIEKRIQNLERRYGQMSDEERARRVEDEARRAEYYAALTAELEERADAEEAEGDTTLRAALDEVYEFERRWRGED